MTDRVAYSRVYWSILDDEKFQHVYDDDRALATWLRLLIVADQAWPSSAHLPTGTRRQSVAILVGAGLVDLQSPSRYRIHGLDAERERRKAAAVRNPNGTQTGPKRDPNGRRPDGLRRDETRRDETSGETRPPLMEAIAYVEERTRRPWVFGPGSKVWDALEPDVRDFGWPAVKVAMEAEKAPFPDAGQLVFGAARRLHPISGPEKQADPDPEYVRDQLKLQREARQKVRNA